MKNRLLILAGVLALLAVVGKFYAVPLYAQVRAAIVQDRDSAGRNIYYHMISAGMGTPAPCQGTCEIDFPGPGSGKRLIVQQISIWVQFAAENVAPPVQMHLRGANPNYDISEDGLFTATPTNYGGETRYLARVPVQVPFESNDYPKVLTFSAAGARYYMKVAVSGYTVDVP